MKRNYKSDFDFRLHLMSGGKEIGFPQCDWTLVLYAFHKSAAFTVLHIGGACVNCYNDDGTPHIVCNGTLDLYIDLPHDCGTEGGSTEPGACAPEATWPEVSGAIDSLFKAN